jgi:hypothetical protein
MKDILIVFDLDTATRENYDKIYDFFSDLGFRVAHNDVMLTRTTLLGSWHADAQTTTDIRNLLWGVLKGMGIPIGRLLVAEYESVSWIGDVVQNVLPPRALKPVP